eukprot:3101156-Pleurochrysis_carterae.AAC.1
MKREYLSARIASEARRQSGANTHARRRHGPRQQLPFVMDSQHAALVPLVHGVREPVHAYLHAAVRVHAICVCVVVHRECAYEQAHEHGH